MRFLILTQYYPPEIGAPQVRLSAMARELKTLGHEVEVVTALPNYPSGRIQPGYGAHFYFREVIDDVPVHRVWLYAATGSGLKRILNYASFALTSLWALWHAKRPDYILVESPPLFLSLPGFIASRLWRSEMIFNVADLWPDSVRELGIIKQGLILQLADKLELWSYRASHRVNAVTSGIRGTLINQKHVPASKVLFLPNGVDTELFRPRSPEIELSHELGLKGQKVFLYTGTLGYAQGLDTVLQAANYHRDRLDITFVFVGDGPEKGKLREIARQLQLNNVRFLDPVPLQCVARLYSLAVAGLAVLRDVPLFEGARPSKMLPIMASGVPILYSGAGEGARLVEQIPAGLVVPPENPQALAAAVAQLADDPILARKLGQNGRVYVEQHLSWDTLIRDWVEQLSHSELILV